MGPCTRRGTARSERPSRPRTRPGAEGVPLGSRPGGRFGLHGRHGAAQVRGAANDRNTTPVRRAASPVRRRSLQERPRHQPLASADVTRLGSGLRTDHGGPCSWRATALRSGVLSVVAVLAVEPSREPGRGTTERHGSCHSGAQRTCNVSSESAGALRRGPSPPTVSRTVIDCCRSRKGSRRTGATSGGHQSRLGLAQMNGAAGRISAVTDTR